MEAAIPSPSHSWRFFFEMGMTIDESNRANANRVERCRLAAARKQRKLN
jgi:hypothetical protein